MEIKFMLVALVLTFTMSAVLAVSYSDMESLYNYLITGRNIYLRPSLNYDEATNITISFTLLNLLQINAVEGYISLSGYFTVVWNDENLTWTPSSYNNAESIAVPYDKIWRPPLINANGIDEMSVFSHDNSYSRVTYTGEVTWLPGRKLDFMCDIDTTYFPFDTQTCEFIMKVWGFQANEVGLLIEDSTINTNNYKLNTEWELTSTYVYPVSGTIPKVKYQVVFKRRPLFLMITLVLPAILLALLNICVFFLPQDSGERIGYAITLLLAVVVFMTIAQALLPATAVPRLSAVCVILLIDMMISGMIVVSIIVGSWFYYRDESKKIPNWIQKIVRCTCTCKRKNQVMNIDSGGRLDKKKHALDITSGGKSTVFEKESLKDENFEEDITWKDVAKVWDNINIYFYIICFLGGNLLFAIDVAKGSQ